MSAAFLKWYLAALKSHPFAANMSTAAVLMSAGDVMAHGIEYSQNIHPMEHVDEEDHTPTLSVQSKPLAVSASAASSPSRRSFTLNRHSTLSPHLEVAHCDFGISRLEWENSAGNDSIDPMVQYYWHDVTLPNWDSVRTSTMALWAGAIQAPFFLVLYRFYDRILPTAITPYAVGSRVALSFASSIPFTAAFFGYGTSIQHWMNHDDDDDDKEGNTNSRKESDSLFWTRVGDTIQQKWSHDLGPTLQTSAAVWVPFNTLNFSLIPPHFRPLSMMIMSTSWNCYLSFVQHNKESKTST